MAGALRRDPRLRGRAGRPRASRSSSACCTSRREEQQERLLARLDDPAKRWKYNPGDLDVRARWADYRAAYTDALRETDTDVAPWYVVPSDRKWYRNWAVAALLAETLEQLAPQYPAPAYDVVAERARVAGAAD